MNRNLVIVLIVIGASAVMFAITRNPLDTLIVGSSLFVADALLRLTKPTKPTIVKKSALSQPQK